MKTFDTRLKIVEDLDNKRVRCVCQCGNEWVGQKHSVLYGNTKSCGCLKRETCAETGKRTGTLHSLPSGESAFRDLYTSYQRSANKRGLEFSLSEDEFRRLTAMPCVYCAEPPSSRWGKKRNNGFYIYSGVDRLNNEEGYTTQNTRSCCAVCNFAKRNMSLELFIKWVERLQRNFDSEKLR